MSDWRQSRRDDKDAWELAACEQSKQTLVNKNSLNSNDMQSPQEWNMQSSYNTWIQSKCNPLSVQRNTEEYKISSSLKNIWSDISESRSTSSIQRNGNTEQMSVTRKQQSDAINTNVIGAEIARKSVNKCIEWDTATVGASNFGSNSRAKPLRPITSRNGSQYNTNYPPTFGAETGQSCGSSTSLPLVNHSEAILKSHFIQESSEKFMQRLQVIVQNGFLDAKILNEPISPETYEYVQMLIFYVMEYSRTKNYAKSEINPTLFADLQIAIYKINLIQNEIAKCQSQYIEAKRVQQEMLQSLMVNDGPILRTQTFSGPQMFGQAQSSMNHELNNRFTRFTDDIECATSNPGLGVSSTSSNSVILNELQNQRCSQTQFDQFVQYQNGAQNTPRKISFLPKTKNCESLQQSNKDMTRKNLSYH
jgi:hypothetical protein